MEQRCRKWKKVKGECRKKKRGKYRKEQKCRKLKKIKMQEEEKDGKENAGIKGAEMQGVEEF